MKRSELEHVIRAAGAVANDNRIVVIGSQSILGQFPQAPAALLHSMEADVFPERHPDRSDLIDGAIGEGSQFHETFGYYAQGVEAGTAKLPEGWRDRLVPVGNVNTNGVTGLCLEVHDLAISKYIAGREKDREFTRLLAHYGMTHKTTLLKRLAATELATALRRSATAAIGRDFGTRPG